MPLEKQVVVIPITGSMDEGVDKQVVGAPILAKSQNTYVRDAGSISTRDGLVVAATGTMGFNGKIVPLRNGILSAGPGGAYVADVESGGAAQEVGGVSFPDYSVTTKDCDKDALGSHLHYACECSVASSYVSAHTVIDNVQYPTAYVRVIARDTNVIIAERSYPGFFTRNAVYSDIGNLAYVAMSNYTTTTLKMVVVSGSTTPAFADSGTSSSAPSPIKQCSLTVDRQTGSPYYGGCVAVTSHIYDYGTDWWGETNAWRIASNGSASIMSPLRPPGVGTTPIDASALIHAHGTEHGIILVYCGYFLTFVYSTMLKYMSGSGDYELFGSVVQLANTESRYGSGFFADQSGALVRPYRENGMEISAFDATGAYVRESACVPKTGSFGFSSFSLNYNEGCYKWGNYANTISNTMSAAVSAYGGAATIGWTGLQPFGVKFDTFLNDVESTDVRSIPVPILGTHFVDIQVSSSGIGFSSNLRDAHGVQILSSIGDGRFATVMSSRWYHSASPRGDERSLFGFYEFQLPDTDLDYGGRVRCLGLQYSCGAIIDTADSDVRISSFFGADACSPNTDAMSVIGVRRIWNWPDEPLASSDPVPFIESIYDLSGGAASTIIAHRRWSGIDIERKFGQPLAFSVVADPLQRTARSWDNAAPRSVFGPSASRGYDRAMASVVSLVSSESTATVVAQAGKSASIGNAGCSAFYDSGSIRAYPWLVPPQPSGFLLLHIGAKGTFGTPPENVPWEIPDPAATGSDSSVGSQLLWATRLSDGTEWRGSPCFPVEEYFHNWNHSSGASDNDVMVLAVPPGPPLLVGQSADVKIEYYSRRYESGESTPGTDMLLQGKASATSIVRAHDTGYSIGWNGYADPAAPTTVTLELEPQHVRFYRMLGLSYGFDRYDRTKGAEVPLYTMGGVLENEPPIAPEHMVTHGGRVWYVRDGDLYYSKRLNGSQPPAFNLALKLVAPDGGKLVGCASLDENVVAFSKSSVYIVNGNGPNDLGRGASFSIVRIASDSGCANVRGIISTASGVFFPGHDSFYMVRRDLNVVRVSAVEKTFDAAAIRAVAQDTNRRIIIWPMDEGAIAFQYDTGHWHLWTGTDGAEYSTGACTLNGTAYFLLNGTLRKLGTTNDCDGVTLIDTGWINLGAPNAFKRIWNMFLVGRYEEHDPPRSYEPDDWGADTGLKVECFWDYKDDPDEVIEETIAELTLASTTYTRLKSRSSKHSAVRLRISTPLRVTWSHLGAEIGVKLGGERRLR